MHFFGEDFTTKLINTQGAIIFLPGAGASVCDGWSPIFSGPPLAYVKKGAKKNQEKILVPPSLTLKKFWSPPLAH